MARRPNGPTAAKIVNGAFHLASLAEIQTKFVSSKTWENRIESGHNSNSRQLPPFGGTTRLRSILVAGHHRPCPSLPWRSTRFLLIFPVLFPSEYSVHLPNIWNNWTHQTYLHISPCMACIYLFLNFLPPSSIIIHYHPWSLWPWWHHDSLFLVKFHQDLQPSHVSAFPSFPSFEAFASPVFSKDRLRKNPRSVPNCRRR